MPKNTQENRKLYAEISLGLKGCWSDEVRVDRLVIESNTCPVCWTPLCYRAFSNPSVYRAFGVCEECNYAREFYTETVEFAAAKRKISERAVV